MIRIGNRKPGKVAVFFLIGILTALQGIASEPRDITDSIGVQRGRPYYDFAAAQTYTAVTLQNISAESFQSPLRLVVTGITSADVQVANADGNTDSGEPFFNFSDQLGDQLLSPGERSGALQLRFDNPLRRRFNFTMAVHTDAAVSLNQPPTAEAGSAQTVRVNDRVTLDGSGSTDPEGDPLVHYWTLHQVPPGSLTALNDPNVVRPFFTADVFGTYVAELLVSDGHLDSAPDRVTIDTANTAPVADAGNNRSAPVGDIVILDGSGSTDVDGNLLTFLWTLMSWPEASTASLSDDAAVMPYFTIDAAGTYELELVVDDGLLGSAPDRVLVTTENSPPVAIAGPDQSVFVGDRVRLDGGGSSDVDGDRLSFFWSLLGTPANSTAILSDPEAIGPEFDIDLPGSYTAQLIVNDDSVDSTPDTVTVSTLNSAPVADAGPDQSVFVTDTVTLDGSGSSDADGDGLFYLWSLIGSPAGSGAILSDTGSAGPSFEVDLPGSYVAQLIVNDTQTASVPETVTVSTENSRPAADAGDDLEGLRGESLILDGLGSSDADGDPLTYAWSLSAQPDDSTAVLGDTAEPQAELIPDLPGTYVAQLLVHDGLLDSDPDTATVSVTNQPPVADPGIAQQVATGSQVTLDGGASSDPEDDPLSFTWRLLTAPANSGAILSNADSAQAAFVADLAGAYTLELSVNDGYDTDTATLAVEALPAPANTPPVITSSAATGARSGRVYRYDVDAIDLDSGDVLIFSLDTSPPGMTIDPNTGEISWTPGATQVGTHPVSVRVTDSAGLFDTQDYALRVQGSTADNTAPQITSVPPTAVTTGQAYAYAVAASDADGDPLSFALLSAPSGMTIDALSGRIDWTPAVSGDYPVAIGVDDGRGGQASQSYVLQVTDLNLAPQITSAAPTAATDGLPYYYEVAANDPNGDSLAYALSEAPAGMMIDPASGVIDWTPATAQIGTHAVTVRVEDPAKLADTESFALGVAANTNLAPIAVAVSDADPQARKVPPGKAVTLDGAASHDPDGDPLSYHWTLVTRPVGSEAVLDDPSAIGPSFEADVFGRFDIELVVNDGKVDSAPDTLTIIATPQVTLGAFHSCVLTKGGGVECWGYNYVGQLGIGTPPFIADPVGIPFPVTVVSASDGTPLSGITAISSGALDHTCALTDAGGVKCWGWNFNGDLGDGTTTIRSAAVDVLVEPDGAPLTGITAIEIGVDHSCAVTAEGGVKCWGWGQHGQLGNDDLIASGVGRRSLSPLDVLVAQGGEPLMGVNAVTAGSVHTCAIMEDTTVKCWGNNDWGALGNGANLVPGQFNDSNFDPVDVLVEPDGAQLTGAVAITAGTSFTCALMDNTGVKCWGINFSGQLGDGTVGQGATDPAEGTISTTPVDVLVEVEGAPLTGVIAISSGEQHTCALMEDRGVKCWGRATSGALGDGTVGPHINFTPVDVLSEPGGAPITGVSGIAAGYRHTCAAMESGGVKCWGETDNGQLGNGEVLVIEGGVVTFNPDPQLTPVDTLLGQDAFLISVVLVPADSTLAPGDSQQFSATGILSDGSTENLTGTATWESSNPAVATVDANGAVTAVGLGFSTIRATTDDFTGSTSVVVSPGVPIAIELQPTNVVLLYDSERYGGGGAQCVDGSGNPTGLVDCFLPEELTEKQLTAIVVYEDGTRVDLTEVVRWSSNNGLVTVDENGLVTGFRGAVDAQVSAQLEGIVAQIPVSVLEAFYDDDTPPVVDLGPADDTLIRGLTDLTARVSDLNLLGYEITLSPTGADDYQVLDTGNAPVDGVVTTIDPSRLENGLYNVRLTATDRGGNRSQVDRVYRVQDEAKVGLFRLSFIDLSLPVSGIPIEIVRTYDSRVKSKEDFGIGWSLDVRRGSFKSNRPPGEGWQILTGGGAFGLPCQFVSETAFHTTEVRLSDTEYYRFGLGISGSAAISGGCTAEAGFTFVDGSTPGASLEILDGNGVFFENGTNRVLELGSTDQVFDPERVRLTTVDGRIIDLDRLAGGVIRIEDLNENSLNITEAGITHSSGKSIAFTRDALGRITGITDPMGNTLTYEYDTAGDLIAFTNQATNRTTFRYDDRHNLTDIFDPLGNRAIRSEYDATGRLVATVDAEGNRTALTHDLQNRREAITDRLGRVTVHEYDEQGNVLVTIDPLGNRTAYTYDARGNELTVTDPLGNVTTNTYDDSNNLLTETDALGHVTTNTYTVRNQLLTTKDAEGNTSSYLYPTSTGNLEAITDPLQHATSLGYDRRGNLSALTDPLNNTTGFEYDGAGNRIKQTDPLGNITTYTFDDNGNELTATTAWTDAAGTAHTLVTRTEYDTLGRVVRTVDPLGNSTSTEYNVIGKVVAETDALERRTAYEYDSLGNRTLTRHPDGSQEAVTYDAEGNQVASTDRAGQTTTLSYDALDRVILTSQPDGSTTRTVYDPAGREIAAIDANGNETNTAYDAAGNRIGVVDALGNANLFSYDKAGLQTQVTDANGNSTTIEYDAAGRRTRTLLPDGTENSFAYDAGGRLTSKTDAANNTTGYEYDAQGRLVAVIDALAQRTTYGYDTAGNLVAQTDANGNTTRYEYDALGRRTATVLPLGQRSSSSYDAIGNLASSTDFNSNTITYGYDANDRLLIKTFPDTSAVAFTYTPTGQRETVTDARGVTRYTYDAQDRLVSRTDPAGESIAYGYDAAGNRTSVTTPSGVTAYGFDARNQLETVTAPGGGLTTYTYDAIGKPIRTDLPNGTQESRTYDAANRLLTVESRNLATGTPISGFVYTLDALGNRIAIDEFSGRRVEYAYDVLSRLTRETIFNPGALIASRTIDYVHDSVGNRQSRDDSAEGVTRYSYDANDRLLSETTGGVVTDYGYDDNGNTLSKATAGVTTRFTWDADNRLVAADTDGDGSDDIQYGYNEDGIRVVKTLGGAQTRYLIDANRPYAQVLEELNVAGTSDASYVYGNDLIAQQRAGQASYYHVDGLGSTRALSDAGGVATDNYTYDAYGRTIGRSGVTDNLYQYAGEQRDGDLGLDYLRARYLDVGSGRFVSRDSFSGALINPLTLQKYVYANVNPIMNADPSGLSSLASVTTAGVIRGNLGRLTFGIDKASGFLLKTKGLINGIQITYDLISLGATVSAILGGPPQLTYDIKFNFPSNRLFFEDQFKFTLGVGIKTKDSDRLRLVDIGLFQTQSLGQGGIKFRLAHDVATMKLNSKESRVSGSGSLVLYENRPRFSLGGLVNLRVLGKFESRTNFIGKTNPLVSIEAQLFHVFKGNFGMQFDPLTIRAGFGTGGGQFIFSNEL